MATVIDVVRLYNQRDVPEAKRVVDDLHKTGSITDEAHKIFVTFLSNAMLQNMTVKWQNSKPTKADKRAEALRLLDTIFKNNK